MSEKNYVRAMLMNGDNHRYIAELDSMRFSEFVNLIARGDQDKPSVTIVDFYPIVEMVHNKIQSRFRGAEDKEVSVQRASIFNDCARIRSFSRPEAVVGVSLGVIKESEKIINLIHTRLPQFLSPYKYPDHTKRHLDQAKDKETTFSQFSGDVDAFLEVLLCNVYATAKLDPGYFNSEFIVLGHCQAIRDIVLDALSHDLNFRNGVFGHRSLIYQSCFEGIGVDPDTFSVLVGSDLRFDDHVWNLVQRSQRSELLENGYTVQSRRVDYIVHSAGEIERAKKLAAFLIRINALLGLLDELRAHDVEYDGRRELSDELETKLNELLR